MGNKKPNYEKIGIYIAVILGFMTLIFSIFDIKNEVSDLKERIAKLEVKIEHLEK